MKFGTFHLMEQPFSKTEHQVYKEHMEQIRLVDTLGFDWVWLTEHHFSSVPYVPNVPGEYCISASPFAMACAIATATKNVRIGTAVKILPLENPLLTAEEAAMADLLSDGRLDFGVGLGYRKYEFEGLEIPMEEKLARFKEGLEIVLGAWTTEEFSYKGQFYIVPRLTLVPRPYQQPHPPVWIATRLGTRDVIDFAVKNGYQLQCAWAPPDELKATYKMMVDSRKELGRKDDLLFTCVRHVFVAESDAEAQRLGSDYVEYYLNSTALFRNVGEHEKGEMIFGGPQTCLEKLERLNGLGVNNLICWMNFGGMPQDLVLRSIRLFAEEVMPKARNLSGKKMAAE
jgi:alkanesulfonate monooxygenase SsuD/methylene tetrahydromethanopterin reductase-like flavin-dependent oxidoreductase (luciferase family)